MSTTEIAPQKSQEDLVGLSPEDNATALHLREQLKTAVGHERALRRRSGESYHRSFGREINEMIEEIQAHRAVHSASKAAIRHYKKNSDAYHEQALIEDTERSEQ